MSTQTDEMEFGNPFYGYGGVPEEGETIEVAPKNRHQLGNVMPEVEVTDVEVSPVRGSDLRSTGLDGAVPRVDDEEIVDERLAIVCEDDDGNVYTFEMWTSDLER